MKRIVCILLATALILSLSGCATAKTIYADDAVQITREGQRIAITDTLTGNEYSLTLRRAKRSQGAILHIVEVMERDSLHIQAVGPLLIVTEANKMVYIRLSM